MSVFKKELKNMVLSDKIKVANVLKGGIYDSKGYVHGLKDNKVVFINLETLKVGSVSIEAFEFLFDELIDRESEDMLKSTCRVLFEPIKDAYEIKLY